MIARLFFVAALVSLAVAGCAPKELLTPTDFVENVKPGMALDEIERMAPHPNSIIYEVVDKDGHWNTLYRDRGKNEMFSEHRDRSNRLEDYTIKSVCDIYYFDDTWRVWVDCDASRRVKGVECLHNGLKTDPRVEGPQRR